MWRTPRCYSASPAQLESSVVFVGNRIQSRDTVYATGIPYNFRDPEQVAEIFSRAGKIRRDFQGKLRIKMYTWKDGSFNGRARITYETDKEAFLACHLIDQERHGDNVLDVKMALNHFRDQRNEPNLEKSDWICHLCEKRGLTRVNYVWQKTCYNCQNDKTFCDSYRKTDVSSLRNEPKKDNVRSPHSILKPPSKKNKDIRNKEVISKEKMDLKSNEPLLNPFYQPKVERNEKMLVDSEQIRPEVTTDSGVHSSSDDDSSGSSSESRDSSNGKTKNLLDKYDHDHEGSPHTVKSEIFLDTFNVIHNVESISSSETETSMDMNEIDSHEPSDHTPMKTENEKEASIERFEHLDNVPENEFDDPGLNTHKLESEIEESLLNIFKKYEIFDTNFPLNIKINVSRAEKNRGLERLSRNNEKINVDLCLDVSMVKSVIQNVESGVESQNLQMKDTSVENVTDQEDDEMDSPQAQPSEKQLTGIDKQQDESTSSDESESDDDNFDKPGSMFIPMHSYAQTSKDANYGEDEKSRRKFTLDQDKVILDKIIDILPGHRLDHLELVAASSPCKEVANQLSRTESSIQGRWKYSLRTWLLEYFKKKTKSWTGFTVKASIERRTAVANYFVKEIKRKGIKMNGLTAKIKQSH